MSKTPVKVGITGSIGMGKTTVAYEMSKANYPVWNSDNAVHELYKIGNEGYKLIKQLVPEAAVGKSVDRFVLSNQLLKKPFLLKKIEKNVHPHVLEKRREFIQEHKNNKIIIFDLPLLFETQCEKWLDFVVVATAPLIVQKNRVLARKNMNKEKFSYILENQLKNSDKVNRADFVINTNTEYKVMLLNIAKVLESITNE